MSTFLSKVLFEYSKKYFFEQKYFFEYSKKYFFETLCSKKYFFEYFFEQSTFLTTQKSTFLSKVLFWVLKKVLFLDFLFSVTFLLENLKTKPQSHGGIYFKLTKPLSLVNLTLTSRWMVNATYRNTAEYVFTISGALPTLL